MRTTAWLMLACGVLYGIVAALRRTFADLNADNSVPLTRERCAMFIEAERHD